MLKIQFKDRRKPAMWLVDSSIKLGREQSCDIVVDDPEVEAVQCELTIEQEEITLCNLSDKKSVFVNELPITNNHTLVANDVIKIGSSELVIIDPLQELSQPRAQIPANKTVIRPAVSPWMLKANSAPLSGQFFQVTHRSSIGRDESAEITIPLSFISRNHANLTIKQDKLYIEDARSSNGTFVNNERIKTCELHNNDEIKLDEFSFIVIGPDEPTREKPQTAVRQQPTREKKSKRKSTTASRPKPQLASEKVFLHDIDKSSSGKVYEIVSKNNHLSKMLGHHISTSETSVSARHVHLNETDLGWEVINNGAADGLIINNKMQIRAILQHEDEITVGGTKLKFQSVGETPNNYFVPKRKKSSSFKWVVAFVLFVAAGTWAYLGGLITF
ncbi:MAG: FHA domain-containing protein [Kangiellaceae bacterium]|nr:FHA domain-containing protein [Kangiellaceae bacterium]